MTNLWWPAAADTKKAEIAPPPVPPQPLSLLDLFDSDFPDYAANVKRLTLNGPALEHGEDVFCYLHFDDRTFSRFLSVYVPDSNSAKRVCLLIANGCDEVVRLTAEGIELIARRVGSSLRSSSKDAPFTKRVYLYHETHLGLPDLGEIVAAFERNGLSVEPRGPQYHSHHMLERRALPLQRPWDKAPTSLERLWGLRKTGVEIRNREIKPDEVEGWTATYEAWRKAVIETAAKVSPTLRHHLETLNEVRPLPGNLLIVSPEHGQGLRIMSEILRRLDGVLEKKALSEQDKPGGAS